MNAHAVTILTGVVLLVVFALVGWNLRRHRRAAYEIIQRKGATNHAIGLTTAALLRGAARRTPCADRVSGAGRRIGNERLRALASVGRGLGGAVEVLEPEMDAIEKDSLMRSAELLRQARRSVG